MDDPGLQAQLGSFDCAPAAPYEQEVQDFIRGTRFNGGAAGWLNLRHELDYQLLLFLVGTTLVAVAAHEKDNRAEREDATLIRVVALAASVRGETLSDQQASDGHPLRLSSFVLEAVLDDARSRGRGGLIRAQVDEGNVPSRNMCERVGFQLLQIDGGLCDYVAILD